MKSKYKRMQKYLRKHGWVDDDISKYPEGVFGVSYIFKNCNHTMINENYKISMVFTKNNNFNIILQIINHPSITYDENEYGEGVIGVIYDSYYMQLYKGTFPGFLKAKSIIYYTCNGYINENKTLLDDNCEFEPISTMNVLPFLMDRLTMEEFEKYLHDFIESDNITGSTTHIETADLIQ